MFNAYDTEIIYKPNDPEVLTEMKRLNKNIDRYDINGVIDKMTPESTAQYLNEKAAHKARRSYLRDYSDGGRYSNVGEYNPARATKEEARNIRDYINDIDYINNRNYYDDVNVKEYLHWDKDIPND